MYIFLVFPLFAYCLKVPLTQEVYHVTYESQVLTKLSYKHRTEKFKKLIPENTGQLVVRDTIKILETMNAYRYSGLNVLGKYTFGRTSMR
jgi:hypothetical protein